MTSPLYITTSIPYVNGAPHLGHALEFVHVDAIARHRRRRGSPVRVQTGTDDHAIKNVRAAAESGRGIADLVRANGDRFAELARAVGLVADEFLRTSDDPRHALGVHALWRACEDAGDLYTRDYTGLYCGGCEQFLDRDELVAGCCPEHGVAVQEVSETNWFFRLSRYRDEIATLVTSGRIEVLPEQRRNEVLGFLAGDVRDISVSRPAVRADGWGVPVPGDDEQVVYVWFDALANYVTGLGYGTQDESALRTWWTDDVERTHVVGKGIVRFHAVYWVAFLLSAGLPLPSRILVHDYLTVDGTKIAKSGAQAADPLDVVECRGQDALRWWLLREPAPVGTCDFTDDRLVARYNSDLANAWGNLASRTLALARRRDDAWPEPQPGIGDHLRRATAALPGEVVEAVRRYDLRAACEALVRLADAGNRFIEAEAPWHLATAYEAGDPAAGARFAAVIDLLLDLCRAGADELAPFVPEGARRLSEQLAGGSGPAFPRIAT